MYHAVCVHSRESGLAMVHNMCKGEGSKGSNCRSSWPQVVPDGPTGSRGPVLRGCTKARSLRNSHIEDELLSAEKLAQFVSWHSYLYLLATHNADARTPCSSKLLLILTEKPARSATCCSGLKLQLRCKDEGCLDSLLGLGGTVPKRTAHQAKWRPRATL